MSSCVADFIVERGVLQILLEAGATILLDTRLDNHTLVGILHVAGGEHALPLLEELHAALGSASAHIFYYSFLILINY